MGWRCWASVVRARLWVRYLKLVKRRAKRRLELMRLEAQRVERRQQSEVRLMARPRATDTRL